MVERVADRLGVPHAILTWRHGAVDAGLQARARAARYDLMAAYCTAHGIPALATAHHLDDQAETFLMRLKRGSGLDGLAAIPEEGRWAGLTLLRPLLDIPKVRLVATAEAAGLFVADPSNDDARPERGHLRGAMAALAEPASSRGRSHFRRDGCGAPVPPSRQAPMPSLASMANEARLGTHRSDCRTCLPHRRRWASGRWPG